ncbi:hypothetical protein CGZ80_09020 [Rhodopirellula sp. MGV]|nr:hypothetical protein CGZ80_09020 [Rhodopirellula sp. MGV]
MASKLRTALVEACRCDCLAAMKLVTCCLVHSRIDFERPMHEALPKHLDQCQLNHAKSKH